MGNVNSGAFGVKLCKQANSTKSEELTPKVETRSRSKDRPTTINIIKCSILFVKKE